MDRKIINNFTIKNFLKIKYKNLNKKVLLIDRGLAESAILNSLFSYNLNKKFLFDIELLNNISEKNLISKIYKSFGIKKLININFKDNLNRISLIFFVNIDFWLTTFKILYFGRSWFIKNFALKEIYFGDLIYDEYIRKNHNFLKRNLININFLKLLFISIFKINFLNNIISKKNYKYVISPTDTYASNAALGLRIALKKKN